MPRTGDFFGTSLPSFLFNPVLVRPAHLRPTHSSCPTNGVRYRIRPCWYPSRQTQRTFQSTLTLCNSPPLPLPRTTVKYIDPVTSSTIYVIGCVHGSYVSAGSCVTSLLVRSIFYCNVVTLNFVLTNSNVPLLIFFHVLSKRMSRMCSPLPTQMQLCWSFASRGWRRCVKWYGI